MALNKKQLKAVELVFEGVLTFGQIAEKLKISGKTLYNWRHTSEFKEAVLEMGSQTLVMNTGKLMRNMQGLAFNGKSEFARLQATQYLLDKSGVGENQALEVNVKPVEIIDDIAGKRSD
ncbi:phBC6A51 family helix-turn-helix protein [Weissella ceti]|uniref:PhBC6A51 family helix-turn-helix protein n=1 Tax=Weissella ceti TaxID=759620 RepID=A0ABT3E483_9LACO|nr:phBC6A51 family helix-turn-helix protein [Weissella ceti]MCW0953202.1 phBC6A51 family helix-turn-helix protein [Weissella ceti]QVK12719.1 hypothetical protein KHQ31_03585 [Weissella ceti]